MLAGGYAAWSEARLPLVDKAALDRFAPKRPSLWVTRRRPKIDRIACPWLIRRFIDAEARILFVDPPEVPAVAKETGAIPFDIEGVEISHEGARCSFDTMLKLFGLEGEPSLASPGADRARRRHRAARSRAGGGRPACRYRSGSRRWPATTIMACCERGFMVYDALFA